jgi:hypothetical protein
MESDRSSILYWAPQDLQCIATCCQERLKTSIPLHFKHLILLLSMAYTENILFKVNKQAFPNAITLHAIIMVFDNIT